MTMFAPSNAPVAIWPEAPEQRLIENYAGENIVRGLSQANFDLLVRSIDLVVLAQTFDRASFEIAMRITPASADLMTSVLEDLGVVPVAPADQRRTVNAEMDYLPWLIGRLTESRSA